MLGGRSASGAGWPIRAGLAATVGWYAAGDRDRRPPCRRRPAWLVFAARLAILAAWGLPALVLWGRRHDWGGLFRSRPGSLGHEVAIGRGHGCSTSHFVATARSPGRRPSAWRSLRWLGPRPRAWPDRWAWRSRWGSASWRCGVGPGRDRPARAGGTCWWPAGSSPGAGDRGRTSTVAMFLRCREGFRPLDALGLAFDGTLAVVLVGSLLTALTPPTDGDALCYHLQVPKLFLWHGRCVL